MPQNDVANKAIEANPQRYSGIVMGALPNGRYSVKRESHEAEPFTPSGLNVRYGDRFTETH